jgi:hypothetical protein
MKMRKAEILDTWLDFCRYWRMAHSKNIDKQIFLWRTAYMGNYPELLGKQIESYELDGLNWTEIAKEIFPLFSSRFPLMQKARNNILRLCKNVYLKAVKNLKLDFDVTFVIYVGVGCGAG